MALVIYVLIRVWMDEVVNLKGDLELIQSLTDKERQVALRCPLLPAAEGLDSHVTLNRHKDNEMSDEKPR